MPWTEQTGKTAPCDKCGTVKRVFQADWMTEKKRDKQVIQRSRWLCATCYRSVLPV